jgi:hypothetical protein
MVSRQSSSKRGDARKVTGSTWRTEEGLFWKYRGRVAAATRAIRCRQILSGRRRSAFDAGLRERDREQARAKQHEAGCGYCKEAFGDKIIVTHDAPADRDAGPNLLKLSESLLLQRRPRTIALISMRKENAGADEAEKPCNHLDHRNCP